MANERGLEIPKGDLDDLKSFVVTGFSGIDLATLSYRLGCISMRQEEVDRLSQIITRAANSTPAGVGMANGSDTDTTTSLPESDYKDEHPTACNDKHRNKADSRQNNVRGHQGD